MSSHRIATVLIDRANYGRLKPLMEELELHPEVDQVVVAGGTMVLRRFKRPVDVVRRDGFVVAEELHTEVEGSTPTSMAKGVGLAAMAYAESFGRLAPDCVLLIGDRYEALGAATAAACQNIRIVHLQGGELSGSIDGRIRHAISQLADYHVPATDLAAHRLRRAGCRRILAVGCPSADLAARITPAPHDRLIICHHPVTTHWETAEAEIEIVLLAAAELGRPLLILWPNIDAGAWESHRRLRQLRQSVDLPDVEWRTNLPPEEYLAALAGAPLAIGNSSSFVRDAGYFGTPVVLVGDRQAGRERGPNVEESPVDADAIVWRAQAQLLRGRYPPSWLYGKPGVSQRIAAEIVRVLEEGWTDENVSHRAGPGWQQGAEEEESPGDRGQVPSAVGG